MNFKLKSRSWAGDMYHKFEAIRQEVDDFVTKDTVKYVENQVQTVGEGVRNICSYVLHDFLPPVDFDAQSQSQVGKKQTNAVGDYARPAFGLKGDHIFSRETDSCKEPGSSVLLDCSDHQRQLSHLASEDISEKPGTGLSLEDAVKNVTEEKCSALRDLGSGDSQLLFNDREEHSINERSNSIESSNAGRELTLNSLESKIIAESLEISDVEDKTSVTVTIISPENLIEVVESEANPACETVCNTECLPEVEDSASSLKPGDFSPLPEGISFRTSSMKTDGDFKNTVSCNFSAARLDSDAVLGLPLEGKTLCRRFSDVLGTSASSEDGSSCFSCKNKHADNHFDNKVGISNPSSAAGPPSQIVNDTCEFIGTVPFGDSLVDEYKHCCRATQLQANVCTLGGGGDDSAVDIDDPDMETIDLTDNVKLEESSIMVDNQLVYTASCRPRRFRSYKRLIQDAFASRKRLIKEYEQLAVLYGEIDADTSLQTEHNFMRPVIDAASRVTASQTCDSCEPDWELV